MTGLITTTTRTYGRRQGRPIKRSKQSLLEELFPVLSINLHDMEHLINPQIYFNKKAPVWFEVGFGGGEHLAELAERNPNINFIGCEPFLNGVVSLLGHIKDRNIQNIRIFQGNAIDLLKTFQDTCLSRFYIMFADPWPKKKHHKRRFVQDAILSIVTSKLQPSAELRLATDHSDYQEWVHQCLRNRTDLKEIMCTFERPADWPSTRYELKALEEGRAPQYMIFQRLSEKLDNCN
jgi:tRNA (guanine-N7-)-methyltransferase